MESDVQSYDSGVRYDSGGRYDRARRIVERLLPRNASALERVLEDVTARIDLVPNPIRTLWRPHSCPTALLPWLAWSLSVDEWDPAWSDATQRGMLAESALLHARKGTPWAVRRALELMGYSNVEIWERSSYRRDGSYVRDGEITHGGNLGPYEFDVLLHAGALPTSAKLAEIRRRINTYKNARSHLRQIIVYRVLHDGEHDHDGSVTYAGAVSAADED
jgi:phage tail P2-like protein